VKALVTGAGGFVGTALVAHLQAEGDEVVGIDHVSGPDITDAAGVREVVDRHRPDAVYHLAAVTHIGASWDAPLDVFRINAEGTLNLLAASTAAGVDRVLVVGSADEYGAVRPEDLPLSEEAPLRPLRLLIERGEPGEVYNVCSGVGHSVAEVADHLLGLARHAIELVPDPSLVRPVEVPRLVGDNTRVRQATGWAPAIPFEETLATILDRWRAEEAAR
jgi:nucleoside-diphosphate-sugar epimerase